MGLKSEQEVAVNAARAAAAVTRAVHRHMVRPESIAKKDKSPVTVADFASQAVVCRALAGAFPNDPVVAEEDSVALRSADLSAARSAVVTHVSELLGGGGASERDVLAWIDRGGAPGGGVGLRFWTLDPIDGTKGFLRGGQYAVALALIEEGRVVLGVLACPNLPPGQGTGSTGSLFVAVRGAGARELPLDGAGAWDAGAVPVRVDGVSRAADARFCESVESGHTDQARAAAIAGRLGITAAQLRMDSQAKYAAVARGDASIYLRLPTSDDYFENIWDHAAGALLVEEAGGRVTDALGRPLDFGRGRTLAANRGVVATNGAVHGAVVEAVRAGN